MPVSTSLMAQVLIAPHPHQPIIFICTIFICTEPIIFICLTIRQKVGVTASETTASGS